jgi:hypothetical protein
LSLWPSCQDFGNPGEGGIRHGNLTAAASAT